MRLAIPINKVPVTFLLGVKTTAPQLIRIVAKDAKKPNSYYYYRKGMVNGYREFDLKMPQTPAILALEAFNMKNGLLPEGEDNSYQVVSLEAKPVKENPIFLTKEDQEFFRFAQWFSENASYLSAGDGVRPSIYRSEFGNFEIDYWKKLVDRKTGAPLNTPARIGHLTGVIELSQEKLMNMTIPMRLVILLHEYSHKYNNPKIGRGIEDEIAADINALRMYLSKGYSEVEAHYAFLTVFEKSDTELNKRRYFIINDFIDKFNKGDFNNITTDYTNVKKVG